MTANEWEGRYETYRADAEAAISRAIGPVREPYAPLTEAMRYSALGGGKRLRAVLTLEFCRVACGDAGRALPFAAAVEMVHAYSLIHDDLPCMDDDALRRGKPACHIRFGEAGALLAGDALLTCAFESALRDCDYDAVGYGNAVRALGLLARCAGPDGMVGGQSVDLAVERAGGADKETLETLDALKTGALIRAACGMGALAGGMDANGRRLCEEFAAAIGLAFQIADDVLDETATSEQLGKTPGKDRSNGKTTYATLYGVPRALELARATVRRAIGALEGLPVSDRFLYGLAERIVERSN